MQIKEYSTLFWSQHGELRDQRWLSRAKKITIKDDVETRVAARLELCGKVSGLACCSQSIEQQTSLMSALGRLPCNAAIAGTVFSTVERMQQSTMQRRSKEY